jgi:hypothetical protein
MATATAIGAEEMFRTIATEMANGVEMAVEFLDGGN